MSELFMDFANFCAMFPIDIGYNWLVKIYTVAAFLLSISAIIAHVEEYEVRSILSMFLLFSISFWMLIIAALSGNNVCFYVVILLLSFATSFLQIKAL